MQINAINNKYTNSNFKASFGIIGDRNLLSSNALKALTKKAESIGTSKDIITVGLAHKAEVVPFDSMNPHFGKLTIFQHSTEITGIAHTFFNVKEPGNFISNVAKFVGTKENRSEKTYATISEYLDKLKESLKNNK